MTGALLLAVFAAACAAGGIVELAAAGTRTRPRRRAGAGRVPTALARLGRRMGVPAAPRDLARRLDAAGAPATVTVAEVMALKGGAAMAAFAAALPMGRCSPGGSARWRSPSRRPAPSSRPTRGWPGRPAVAALRWRPSLPEVLDLLHVAVAAGLPALRALGEVGRRRGGPLATELRAAAAGAALGVPHAQALDRLAHRCPLHDVAALVAAIGRCERHGAPLAPALRALAADARAQRAQRVRERAARAAPKIQLVVALLLVPAVMLLVGACLSAAILAG